ncbi:MAG: hypothetical protein ACOYM4_15885 [Nodosilinea sp.]|jgi:hypothetical protein
MRPSSPSLLGLLLVATVMALPASGHKTEVSGDIAGTWHLEPNHSPRAGEPARVWIALTQQGGKAIPLEQCDCQLTVYDANQAGSPPVMALPLQAMSPENFQSIPGAEVTFPTVGEYRLVLTGSPRADAVFTPFELSYTTVVAAGRPTATPAPAPATAPEPPPAPAAPAAPPEEGAIAPNPPQPGGAKPWVLGGLAGGAVLALAFVLLQRRKALDP